MNETRVEVSNSVEVQIRTATPHGQLDPLGGTRRKRFLSNHICSTLAAVQTHCEELRPPGYYG